MSSATILIVDDEPDIRSIISDILSDEGFHTLVAENAEAARRLFSSHQPDLVLLDIWMPDTDGITLLKEWCEQGHSADIIMISGHGTVETAVEAIRIGAYDFLEKPLSTAKLLVTVRRALENRRLQRENIRLKKRLVPHNELIGNSDAMLALRQQIGRFASTNSWVLIHGEAGSGKGVAARNLHLSSERRNGAMVELNLAALPTENLAVQLFGHESDEGHVIGSLEQANGGSLVLDEVGDLSTELQGKLLSALNERRFYRVGGHAPVEIDVRVIATTNQNLQQKIADGLFRRDLFDRLNQLPIYVPPLREHPEDIPELVDSFVRYAIDEEGFPYRRFSIGALNILRQHSWPGNIRELSNFVHRMLITADTEEISREDILKTLNREPSNVEDPVPIDNFQFTLREAREAFERSYLTYHLENVSGNMSELAIRTGLERTHLYRKLKGLGIDPKSMKSRR